MANLFWKLHRNFTEAIRSLKEALENFQTTTYRKEVFCATNFWNATESSKKSKRVFEFFGTIINGKHVTKSWKSLSEKASGLEEVCPSCLRICVKSIPSTTTSSSWMIWWLKQLTTLWYLDCLRKAAFETPMLSYCCKTCFIKANAGCTKNVCS